MAIATQAAATKYAGHAGVRDGAAGIRTGGPAFEARTLAMMRGLRSVLGQSAASPGVSAETTYERGDRFEFRVLVSAAPASRDVRPHGRGVGRRQRAQRVHGDFIEHFVRRFPAIVHTVTASSRTARSRRSPERIRVLTVPSGVCERRAISWCVTPPKNPSSIGSRCSGGSEASALRTRCGVDPRERGVLHRLVLGKSFGQFGLGAHVTSAQNVERAIARDASDPGGEVPAAKKVGSVPQFEKDRLRDVFGAGAVAKHPQRDAIDNPMVRIVEQFECIGVLPSHSRHQRVGVFGHLPTLRFAPALPSDVLSPNGRRPLADSRAAAREVVGRWKRSSRACAPLVRSSCSPDRAYRRRAAFRRFAEPADCGAAAASKSLLRRKASTAIRCWCGRGTTSVSRRIASAQPNAGHDALARLETLSGDFTLATQNVDSLHLRAGSRRVLELHGNLREARCTDCGARRPLDAEGLPLDEIDHACGGRMRPCVVWFGEPLPADVWAQAEQAAARADVILVVGTSAVVYPAAALATQYARGAYVVEINPEATPMSDAVDLALRETAASALPRIVEALSRD